MNIPGFSDTGVIRPAESAGETRAAVPNPVPNVAAQDTGKQADYEGF